MSQAYCDSSIAWLEAILSERFGGQVSISQYGAWSRLSLRGSPKAIRFFSDSATFTRNDSDLPIAYWDGIAEGWHVPGVLPLPAPGASRLPDPLIQQHDAGYTVGYDVVGLTYWMLSRQEEVAREDLDEHGRFPATASHAFKHHYLERPVVDEWLNVVGQVLQRLCPEFTLKE